MDYTSSHFAWSFWDYTQKSTISTLAVKLSVSAIFTPGGLPQQGNLNISHFAQDLFQYLSTACFASTGTEIYLSEHRIETSFSSVLIQLK